MSCVLDARLRKLATENPTSFLVIGYGNQLRGDDGIGQLVAAEIEQWNLPQVCVEAVHQLTPELAAMLASVHGVIFVDACVYAGEVEELLNAETAEFPVTVERIEPATEGGSFSLGHLSNPRSLLALTLALYGHAPQGWLVSVPGIHFELSDRLSPIAEKGVAAALEQIEQLILGR